ncbi:hypothetical protein [Flavobacterium sp.]|uniref:hypothetical protein n=1 Tax=Flavobacterium sp. TaxID=239 RepID=UPI0025BFECB3|nr:hypothetical protein [Flavobacterium sp.]
MKNLIVLLFVFVNAVIARGQDVRLTSIETRYDTLPPGKIIRSLAVNLKNSEPNIKIVMTRILETEIFYKDSSISKRDTTERRWFDLSVYITATENIANISSIKGKVEVLYSRTIPPEKKKPREKQNDKATKIIYFDLPISN